MSELMLSLTGKVRVSNVDKILNKVNNEVEKLRRIKEHHDAVVSLQKMNIDNANSVIKQSTEEMNRAESAINKIKELATL